jgi:4-hydroxymandelate oxidase
MERLRPCASKRDTSTAGRSCAVGDVMTASRQAIARRRFLGFLASSPLAGVMVPGSLGRLEAQAAETATAAITSAEQALNVFDLQAVAARTMRPAHYGYLQTGVLDDRTVAANRDGFSRYGLRARRLVDVRNIETSIELFGRKWASPVALAPVSSQRAFHHEAERPSAKAARRRDALQMISTLTNVSFETLMDDRQAPLWFQLYPTNDATNARKLVERADGAGAGAIVLTVDLLAGGMRRETQALQARQDTGDCQQCHDRSAGFAGYLRRKAMFDGLDLTRTSALGDPGLTWDFVRRVRSWTKKPVLVKGVMSGADADQALAFGADGIIVSNHGGRAEESLIGAIDVLPEVVAAVRKRVPVLIDGGFRRGSDVFKAMALGANAVCIGRPYIWGLSGYGQAGVEAAMRLIDEELVSTMRQAGVTQANRISADDLIRLAANPDRGSG